ncbi:MAG TPA: NB-ARC domain-containing protein [Anaerolineae bacterium]|nr:NB-ARC domain-containing protein [Anaerolineae bacterium]
MPPQDTAASQAFAELLQQALRAYRHDDRLAALPGLADLHLVRAQRRCQPGDTAMAIRSVLGRGLERLAQSDSTGADLLSRRFVQGQTAVAIAHALGYSESAIWIRQRQAISSLAQIILEAESEASQAAVWDEARQAALDSLPPPTFTRLFGVDAPLASLAAFLSDPASHWLVALEGMGGIGKTALARQAVEDLVCQGRFQTVAWVTAQQHAFVGGHLRSLDQPALTFAGLLDQTARSLGLDARLDLPEREQAQRLHSVLARRPTLLVVDNLETAADIWALVEGLDRLARPAKVLLTTRQRVDAHDQVTSVPLAALPPADALAFLRYHGEERNAAALLHAPQSDLQRIVAVTGGHPLAIKLVVGQAQALPLRQVLDDLAAAQPEIHDFYHFLFRYSWQRLSEPARQLLLHMPLLDPAGATWEDLAAVSGASLNGFYRNALEELVAASLLDVGCAQGRLLYSIHRLTEYFILSDLIGVAPLRPLA